MNEIKLNNNTVTIREMVLEDIKTVFDLEKQIFSDPWSKRMFIDQVKEPNWGGLVALSEGNIIGYACYYVAVNEFHLTNIAVTEQYRRKSVAKELLANILSIAEKNNSEFVLLEVRPSNQSARAFYEKHGFKFLYERPNYYHRPKEDAWVLVKYLDK